MDLSSYLASVGTAISNSQNSQSIGLAVTKKVMDVKEMEMNALIEMISAPVSFGHKMDIRV